MSKIVCDICGTTFSDTEEQCPICGCAKDVSAGPMAVKMLEEELTVASAAHTVTAKAKKAPVFEEDDFDEDEYDDDEYDEDEDYDEDDDDEDEEDDEDEHKSNAPLIIALVLVILVLIALGAFILVKYFLPNMDTPQVTEPVVETTEPVVETTELKIPCESLALTSGGEIVLENEGANWLINVMALPENTTDELVYISSDEAVVTVNAQGKLTAVAEGTAVITIICGEQELKCTVTCDFTVETTAPSEPEETTDPSEPEETTEPTEPTEAPKPTEPLKDIDLASAINYKELTFNGPNQAAQMKINGLKNTEVKWSSEDESVATIDENGRILNTGKGTTYIVCKYGDQEVKIKIICKW